MALTGQNCQDALVGLMPGASQADGTRAKQFFRTVIISHHTDLGIAASDMSETVIWENLTGGTARVLQCKVATPVIVANHATNIVTFTLQKRDAAGINNVSVATQSTVTAGGFAPTVAFLSGALTMSTVAGATSVVANGFLTFKGIKATGQACCAATGTTDINGPVSFISVHTEIEQIG